MYSEAKLHELIRLIYGAAADSTRWPIFLQRYNETLDARNVAMGYLVPNSERVVVIATGADETDIQKYHRYPCPWLSRLLATNWHTGGADASHHLVSDRELENTECFSQFLGPRQFHYGMGAAILAVANGPATFVTLREKSKGPYADEDLAFLRTLLPHMSQAFQLYTRIATLEAGRRALADALDRLATGILLLDSAGRVLLANRTAQGIVDQNDGLRLDRFGLSAALPGETASLRRLIGRAAQTTNGSGTHAGGAFLISRPSFKRPFALTVSPLPLLDTLQGLPDTPAVVVYITDPEAAGDSDASLLARLYGLSPAESRVAAALLEGNDLREAAGAIGVSYHTARTQAKSIFAKTGTNGQADLMRLLLKLPVRH